MNVPNIVLYIAIASAWIGIVALAIKKSDLEFKVYELRKEIERISDFHDQTDAVKTKFLLDTLESFRIQLDKKMDKREKPKK